MYTGSTFANTFHVITHNKCISTELMCNVFVAIEPLTTPFAPRPIVFEKSSSRITGRLYVNLCYVSATVHIINTVGMTFSSDVICAGSMYNIRGRYYDV